MNKLSVQRQSQVVKALCEGNSIRSTSRMADVAVNTVIKLLADLGAACLDYQDAVMVNLPCQRLQCDEIWSFVYSKARNVPDEHKGEFGYGDVWTWTAIDADTKLVPCWYVGARDGRAAYHFIKDLAGRMANRMQLTTDGHTPYLAAIEGAFGAEIDYAMLIKQYGPAEPAREAHRRYSPAVCIGTDTRVVQGRPDPAHISTSYVERANLTMRMSMRRFTRLTNAFSKKLENHMHALALYFMHYNFARPHKSLGNMTTPAMAAGLTDHVWATEELLSLLERSN